MLVGILAIGLGLLLSQILGYGSVAAKLEEKISRYESEYQVRFGISLNEYEALSSEGQKNFDAAYDALIADQEVLDTYRRQVNLMVIIVNCSLLVAYLVLEFALPLKIGHGRSPGKWAFGLAVTDADGSQARPSALFIRAVLGKFALCALPLSYLLTMMFFGTVTMASLAISGILIMVQLFLFLSPSHAMLQDRLSATAVVDLNRNAAA
ncbi:MAG: RDD family protein [Lachnospiraceae bacterium]|nr:RDD family protein [Lachnospiraceae bacterium]